MVLIEALVENSSLKSTINAKNRQIREQKKTIVELASAIIKCSSFKDGDALRKKAASILENLNKKKKNG